MKKLLFAIMAIFAAVVATAQTQNYVIDVKDFNELKVTDGVNVIWKCDADSAGLVSFTTTPEMVPLILLENKKNQLKIELQDVEHILKHIPTLTVYSNFVKSMSNNADSTVYLVDPEPTAEINLRVVGNGRIVANSLKATTVDAKVDTGSGRIVLGGITQLLKLRNAGAGTIEAANLQADEGAFTVLGTGSIDCWVTDKLSVKGLGSGKVYLKGDAEVKNRTLGTVKVVNVE